MKSFKRAASAALFLSVNTFAGFLPSNSLNIPNDDKSVDGLSEAAFHRAIDRVEVIYGPIAKKHGGNLIINRKWDDGTVNAGTYRSQNNPTDWIVNMYGGFARHRFITEDGFSLVLCHEIGHHIGGAPKKESVAWSSTEGQSDYFATLKCLRRVFQKDDNLSLLNGISVPMEIREQCKASHWTKQEAAKCMRISLAGLAVAKINASTSRLGSPDFAVKDETKVTSTMAGHPPAQCRLDTYVNGALCSMSSKFPLSQSEERIGACHRFWGSRLGLRPECWFKSK